MSDERRRSLWDIRTWPRAVKFVVVVAGLAGAGAAAWYSRDAVLARSKGVQDTLRSLIPAMEQFKQACVVDQNDNGMGEYGWLGELSGVQPCRTHGMRMNVSPFVAPALGEKDAAGRSVHQGYVYHLALPLPENRWQLEPAKVPRSPARSGPHPVADLQEKRWICYAWPDRSNLGVKRVYVVNHTGEIWFTEGDVKPYRGDDGPRVSAAFPKTGQGPPGGADAPSYTGADGNTWTVLDR